MFYSLRYTNHAWTVLARSDVTVEIAEFATLEAALEHVEKLTEKPVTLPLEFIA